MGDIMKNRRNRKRSYDGALMGVGKPGELYIARYLQYQYDKVESIGAERQRRDYRCSLADGTIHLNEGKTDTMIAKTNRITWEAFRLEKAGQRAYISWGYGSDCYRVIYFVPQQLKLLDVYAEAIRALIFSHIMGDERIPIWPTVTDEDRITFNFCIPIDLLKAHSCVKVVEISEVPLEPVAPHQGQLIMGSAYKQ